MGKDTVMIDVRKNVLSNRRECSHCRKVEFDELLDISERMKAKGIPGVDVWKVPYVISVEGREKCLVCFLEDNWKSGLKNEWKPAGDVSERWRMVRELEFMFRQRYYIYPERGREISDEQLKWMGEGFKECLDIIKSMG